MSRPELDLPLVAMSAALLNRQCACQFLDQTLLNAQLDISPQLTGLAAEIARTRPHLFSSTMVFISPAEREQMQAIVRAVSAVAALPGWQQQALENAPVLAGVDGGGVFYGYDFHLGTDGPQLIEINTNAGGAMLNLALARAQVACCEDCPPLTAASLPLEQLENAWLAMFEQEWAAKRSTARPRSIAIIDEAPEQQYLYPEFLLFQRFFERAGIRCFVADPSELRWHDGQLWLGFDVIDMVYNRLTDFYLEQTSSQALRQAFVAGDVVLTPTPRAHALFADKRHLARLSAAAELAQYGLSQAEIRTLQAGVPATFLVTPASADALWAARRTLFFKPADGFGSKATYRGDKLTKRVWGEILASNNYVAQTFAPPSERYVEVAANACSDLKLDVRAYVYQGEIQLFAARLYSGQTTNFRTQGGGFAPVYLTAT